jgi:heat-inducible transcriptional repressor
VEVDQSIPEAELRQIQELINMRLAGLTLSQIRAQIAERVSGLPDAHPGLVRFFVDSADRLFTFSEHDDFKIGGRAEVLSQPEFSDPRTMRGIIELIEDKDIIVHLLQTSPEGERVAISIGSENADERAKDLSVLAANYRTSTLSGKVGVIGPTRMDYSKMKSLLDFTARTITRHLEGGSSVK